MFTSSSSSTTTDFKYQESFITPSYVERNLAEILDFIKKLYNEEADFDWFPDTIPFTRDEIIHALEDCLEGNVTFTELKNVFFFHLGVKTNEENQRKFYETILTEETNALTQYLIYLTPQQSPLPDSFLRLYQSLLPLTSRSPMSKNEDKKPTHYEITIEKHRTIYSPSLMTSLMLEKQRRLSAMAIRLHETHNIVERAKIAERAAQLSDSGSDSDPDSDSDSPKKSAPETHSDSSSLPAPLPTQAIPSNKPKSNWSFSRLFSCCCSSVEDNENSLAVPLVSTATPGNGKGSA